MNIILLSGGSGKRMWPLSNDIRSKQFIKLFKKENNEYESMVQRVFRQIKKVDETANIIVATSKSQVSAVHNQIGDDVSVCVEPCRRDTFPAIVLSAVYIHDVMKMPLEASVVVCPVDPYVDISYYECVKKLSLLAAEGSYSLNLMGIEPTCPSEKYGYIIPENSENISKVKEFKEKPSEESAIKYIEKGALWNAGVFAFKLKYLLNIAREKIDFTDYEDLKNKYDLLEKISFDYMIAEKEKSVCVMRYSGEWRDVGTWNMMTEVMSDRTKGNVTLDEKCENTYVVNETDIPVLCMGCRNMIIAASVDGILISDKDRSAEMKPYVEKIVGDVMYAEKSWGIYQVIDVQQNSMTVKIMLKKGAGMSYHCHKMRDEIWTVTSGVGMATVDGKKKLMQKGDVISIKSGIKHMIFAETDLNIIEVQIGEYISAADKEKFKMNCED